MSDKEEQIEIDLNDVPEIEKKEDAVEIIDDAPPEKNAVSGDDGIEELRRRLDAERAARVEAEARANELANRANAAFYEVEETQLHLVGSALESVKRDQDALRRGLREAMEIGDYDKAAQINDAMSMNNVKLSQLEQGLTEMKAKIQSPERIRHVEQPKSTFDVDDLINRVTPLSANWLKNNRDHLKDQRALRIVARAHEDAVDMGIIPESEDYFRLVESRLGINRKQVEADEAPLSAASAPAQRRSAPPPAPVSRGTSPRQGVGRLTASQAEAAKISGLTNQEYYELMMREKNRNQTH